RQRADREVFEIDIRDRFYPILRQIRAGHGVPLPGDTNVTAVVLVSVATLAIAAARQALAGWLAPFPLPRAVHILGGP
ncbi:MAG TPA: hypothetical protein PKU97_23685, partial [Kofleriaceae bacterium]|nr:hypothetical protein [Kofleriaceae bacterium]